MEPEDSLPHLQKPVAYPYPRPDRFSPSPPPPAISLLQDQF
jgi:hypothetical protein